MCGRKSPHYNIYGENPFSLGNHSIFKPRGNLPETNFLNHGDFLEYYYVKNYTVVEIVHNIINLPDKYIFNLISPLTWLSSNISRSNLSLVNTLPDCEAIDRITNISRIVGYREYV